jgi:Zn-finger protein
MAKIPCTKKGFKTKARAEAAIVKINNDSKKDQVKDLSGTYKCSNCKMWHLTSMSKEVSDKIEANRNYRENTKNPPKDYIEKRIEYLSTSYRNSTKFNSKLKKPR